MIDVGIGFKYGLASDRIYHTLINAFYLVLCYAAKLKITYAVHQYLAIL